MLSEFQKKEAYRDLVILSYIEHILIPEFVSVEKHKNIAYTIIGEFGMKGYEKIKEDANAIYYKLKKEGVI